ncbi:hypothetical protein RB600_002410 [Gaeumannomyces tritici]
MRASATRTLRPLRPAALLPFRTPLGCRSVVTAKPAASSAAKPRAPARAVYSKSSTTSATTAAKPTTTAAKPTAAAAAAAAAAKPAMAPEPLATPILDPQAAATPSEAATAASRFTPVPDPPAGDGTIDWSASFHGLGSIPYSTEAAQILMAPLDPEDVEVKPDGIIYLPEIKYRRILNRAFGPGGWGLAPRGELIVGEKIVTREYALVCHGRFVGQARGECQYFSDESIPTAGEGCKSNALMRCCKDLGIGSELWDPRFIRSFKKQYAQEVWVEHVVNKKKRQIWTRKDGEVAYPYKRT